jgi:hypothetical protein
MKPSQNSAHTNLETVSEVMATNGSLTRLIIREILLVTVAFKISNYPRICSSYMKRFIYVYVYIYISIFMVGECILFNRGQSSWLHIWGPGSIPGTTRKKSSGSGTGSTQPREYN